MPQAEFIARRAELQETRRRMEEVGRRFKELADDVRERVDGPRRFREAGARRAQFRVIEGGGEQA